VPQVRGTGARVTIELIPDITTDIEQRVVLEDRTLLQARTNKHSSLLIPIVP
jgi:hypothetical protein